MRFLLDTHIWLWSLLDPERLSQNVSHALRSSDNEIWLSPISVWEALMLVERGRILVEGDPTQWVEAMIRALPRREARLTHQIAVESRRVSLSHQDPADRFLVATALAYDLTLVTADERLLGSPDIEMLSNR